MLIRRHRTTKTLWYKKLKQAGVPVSFKKVPETGRGWMRVGFGIEEFNLRGVIQIM
jgi:hypothetical protein